MGLLRNYFKRNFYRYFFVKFQDSFVATDFLNRFLDVDNLANYFETSFSQCISYLDIRYRTEDCTC